MSNGIEEKVIDIINSNAKYEDVITSETKLVDDMGFTSIELVEMVYQIESEFNITLSADDMDFDRINVVKNLVELISEKVSREVK